MRKKRLKRIWDGLLDNPRIFTTPWGIGTIDALKRFSVIRGFNVGFGMEMKPDIAQGDAAMWRGLRWVATLLAFLEAGPGICETPQEKPAATMRDVEAHFGNCLRPFHEADGSQLTIYFSVKSDGQVFGRPRAVSFGSKANDEDRKNILSDFLRAFRSCTPLQLNKRMAQTIPGKVYYLQFRGDSNEPEVIVRPYGSEGPPLVW
jgi:hypothetical protein